MKKSLLDVIFASEKRKNILLLLRDGEQEMESLLKSLGTSRQSVLPQMKILQEHYLVDHYDDTYQLTTVGKLIVDEMVPLLSTFEVLNVDIDYWGSRNLDFIPPHLLEKIYELEQYNLIKPTLAELYEVNRDFIESSKNSISLFFVFTFMHPSFPAFITQFIKNDINTSIVITQELLAKLKKEWLDEVNQFIASGKVQFYLCKTDLKVASLSVSDSCLDLRLLSKRNDYDYSEIFSCNSQARQWGKLLFEHHLKDSVPITEF